ncbi:hypothetical protein TNIN_266581 [Trichonephila inaurata madagascariensis]|uniref:Uncharacterized protein n=1 Tax=Trichonephila inaurata madagascariensis TaxID=2747483 RepID=A0A8X6WUV6_9ARAC|nr:hypothetical protein TNIN_266581 [Trichonephila inaurata madagascariensis]
MSCLNTSYPDCTLTCRSSKFCGSSGVCHSGELPVASHEFSMGDWSGLALGSRTVFVAARLALEMAAI